MTKQHIIDKIQEIAKSDGAPPGMKRFQSVTGMKRTDWYGKYWAKWSEALIEAGFEANEKSQAYSKDVLLQRYLELVIELGKLPSEGELRLRSRNNPDFPEHSTFFNIIGNKSELLPALLTYVEQNKTPEHIVEVIAQATKSLPVITPKQQIGNVIGYVYLIKFGDFFKIGRSNDFDRRLSEIKTKLPEEGELIHVIETDDPEGIEAYWHNRFKDRRARGEWFKLSNDDVKILRKRKFM